MVSDSIKKIEKFIKKCNKEDILNLWYEMFNNNLSQINHEFRMHIVDEICKADNDFINRGF